MARVYHVIARRRDAKSHKRTGPRQQRRAEKEAFEALDDERAAGVGWRPRTEKLLGWLFKNGLLVVLVEESL
jgi:hypothetical protein